MKRIISLMLVFAVVFSVILPAHAEKPEVIRNADHKRYNMEVYDTALWNIYQDWFKKDAMSYLTNTVHFPYISVSEQMENNNWFRIGALMTGRELDHKKCIEILSNMMAMVSLDTKEMLAAQMEYDSNKTSRDYAVDLADITAGIVSLSANNFIGKNLSTEIKSLANIIGINDGLLEFTVDSLEVAQCLKNTITYYEGYKEFLEPITQYCENDTLRDAASELLSSTQKLLLVKLELLSDLGKSAADFMGNDLLIDNILPLIEEKVKSDRAKELWIWTDSEFEALQTVNILFDAVGLVKDTVELGLNLGVLASDMLLGFSDVTNRIQEMIALRYIRDSLLKQAKHYVGIIKSGNDYENIYQLARLFESLFYVDYRGDYCLVEAVTKDAQASSLKLHINGEAARFHDMLSKREEYVLFHCDRMSQILPELEVVERKVPLGTLTSRVVEANETPIADAEISVYTKTGELTDSTVSDGNGQFEFSLADGEYYVTASKDNYRESGHYEVTVQNREVNYSDWEGENHWIVLSPHLTYQLVTPTEQELAELPQRLENILLNFDRDYDSSKDDIYDYLLGDFGGYNVGITADYADIFKYYFDSTLKQDAYSFYEGYDEWYHDLEDDPLHLFKKIPDDLVDSEGVYNHDSHQKAYEDYGYDGRLGYFKRPAEIHEWLIEGVWNGYNRDMYYDMDAYYNREGSLELYYYDGYYYSPYRDGADMYYNGPDEVRINSITPIGGNLYSVNYEVGYVYSINEWMPRNCIVGLKEASNGFRFWSVYKVLGNSRRRILDDNKHLWLDQFSERKEVTRWAKIGNWYHNKITMYASYNDGNGYWYNNSFTLLDCSDSGTWLELISQQHIGYSVRISQPTPDLLYVETSYTFEGTSYRYDIYRWTDTALVNELEVINPGYSSGEGLYYGTDGDYDYEAMIYEKNPSENGYTVKGDYPDMISALNGVFQEYGITFGNNKYYANLSEDDIVCEMSSADFTQYLNN